MAIKFLRPSGVDGDTASARFVAEAKSAARVKHRFVVDVFDFGITELGEYYMVQELLEGEELADCMLHGAAWEATDVIQFMAQCLSGLEAVHQAGIVHRDLKPENIFVMRDSDGRFPKLLDFGISKSSELPPQQGSLRPPVRTGRQRQITSQGTALGTPWYMSPEQLRGRRDLDGRADIYSIGVILYEWLSGHVPYAEDNLAELSLQVASNSAAPLVSLRPELGHGVSSVIARALAPEPDGRFTSAAEMREALTALVPSLPRAWSIVQKKTKTPGSQTPPKLAARGAKTEALLSAAADAFGNDAAPKGLRRVLSRELRPFIIAAGVLVGVILISLPLFRAARPERAAAGAAHTAPRERSPVVPAPASPAAKHEPAPILPASSPPALGQEIDPTEPPAPAATTHRKAASSRRGAGARGTASSTELKPGSTRSSPPKKVIRTLDF